MTVWLLVVAASIANVVQAQSSGRRALRQRFDLRASLGAHFVSSYVSDIFGRQADLAGNQLSGSEITSTDVDRAALALGYPAAVLLDKDGRVLHSVPNSPGLIGQDLASRYVHLRQAVDGQVAISGVVPSAVAGRPVIAFAVPFNTEQGRRVFSGGFDVADTPLASFLRAAVPVEPNQAYLVDSAGSVVSQNGLGASTTASFATREPGLSSGLRRAPSGLATRDGTDTYFTSTKVAGTPWTLVIATPATLLYAPLAGQATLLWLLAAAMAVFAIVILWLVIRVADESAARRAALEALEAQQVELEAARDAAVDDLLRKSTFLATMGHEIRTPLTGVIGFSDLLMDTRLSEEQGQLTNQIRTSGQHLLALVNDLLDVAKAEAGKLVLEQVDFDLPAVVEGVRDLLAVTASSKSLALIVNNDEAVPTIVRGDPGRLRQVLTNLVGNAVKFTESGAVRIDFGLLEETSASLVVRFEVEDTGVGIAAESHLSVFEPYSQADASTTREYGGTGLGLAITRQLVELMGGTCGVTSELGKGSRFWFTARFERVTSETSLPSHVSG